MMHSKIDRADIVQSQDAPTFDPNNPLHQRLWQSALAMADFGEKTAVGPAPARRLRRAAKRSEIAQLDNMSGERFRAAYDVWKAAADYVEKGETDEEIDERADLAWVAFEELMSAPPSSVAELLMKYSAITPGDMISNFEGQNQGAFDTIKWDLERLAMREFLPEAYEHRPGPTDT